MKPIIYFDNNATTQTAPEVFAAMQPYFTEKYGNAGSIHTFGGGNKKVIDEARRQVAALINADSTEIIFNSGGTEGDNTAIASALKLQPEKKHIITTAVEHPAVLEVFKNLAQQGYKVDFIGVDGLGRFDMTAFKKAINGKDTALVSVMWANSETGVIFPVEEIGKICRAYGAIFHVDAVQALGKIEVDVKKIGADMISFSAHKIHGPKGTGALYVKKGLRFFPFIIGGHQEKGRRAGTENVPGIVGFGKAAELAKNNLHLYKEHVAPLRDELEKGLLAIEDTRLNGDPAARLPNTTNISFGYIEGESILIFLGEHGICASSGSACTSGSLEPSHVLRAMGVGFQFAHGSIRFSLSKFNTREEVRKVLEVMPAIVKKLRDISPFRRPQTVCSIKDN